MLPRSRRPRATIQQLHGHSVEAAVVLDYTIDERPRFRPIEPGNRSLVFQFDSLEASGQDEGFGARIEKVTRSEHGYVVLLCFWADVASVYATPDAQFRIWYGGVAGRRSVLLVVE